MILFLLTLRDETVRVLRATVRLSTIIQMKFLINYPILHVYVSFGYDLLKNCFKRKKKYTMELRTIT